MNYLEIISIFSIGSVLTYALIYLKNKVIKLENEAKSHTISVDMSNIDMSSVDKLTKEVNRLPDIILNSITGLTNTHKGKLGELIGYIHLKAEYDRIIPLGNITDFLCIKFSGDKPGYIHFVDIKTGKNARLNSDQKMFKELLDNKLIEFKTIRIEDVEI